MRFVQCRPQDRPSINRLIESWYGKGRQYSKDKFLWAFFDRTPTPSLLLSVVKDSKIVGTQAILPMDLRSGKETFRSGKSEETLLDKDYRGMGLFHKLYQDIFNKVDNRIDVIWGTTSAKKPFVRCGFSTPARVIYTLAFTGKPGKIFPVGEESTTKKQKLKRTLFSIYHRAARHKTALLCMGKKVNSAIVEKTDYDFYQDIWLKMAMQFPAMISVDRDSRWLKWRLEKNPDLDYRMLLYENGDTGGGLIFTINKKTSAFYLVDFVAGGDIKKAAEALVEALVLKARKEGYGTIVDIALDVNNLPPQKARIEALTRYGCYQRKMKDLFFVVRTSPGIGEKGERITESKWYYSYLMTHGYRV